MKTQENHNKFSKKWKSQNKHSKIFKNMLKPLIGLSNTLKTPFKIKVLFSKDHYTQDKSFLISNVQTFKCTKNLSSFMNLIMRDVFTPFIQR